MFGWTGIIGAGTGRLCGRILLVLMAGHASRAIPQVALTPNLVHRSYADPAKDMRVEAKGHLDVPAAAQGEYLLGSPGEVIQLSWNEGKVDGYISTRGDGPSDAGTLLTWFFQKTHAQGDQVEFTTAVVHAVWYSFEGRVVRGSAEKPTLPGFYVLKGVLTTHLMNGASHLRQVTLDQNPSFSG